MLKNLPTGDLVLEASMLGYKTEEKKVTTQADKLLEVNFDLEEDAVALDEVVVSATRNETSKKRLPSSSTFRRPNSSKGLHLPHWPKE
ncbi:MAG: carboxypeptidase-like regulatory domain-containing protein [Alistipes indistinctus]